MLRYFTMRFGIAIGVLGLSAASAMAQYYATPGPSVVNAPTASPTPAANGVYAPNATFYVVNGGAAPGQAPLSPQAAPVGAGGVPDSACAAGTEMGGGLYGFGGPGSYSRLFWLNDGDGMPEHLAYYPALHGYYYFHPYNHMHVVCEQRFATQFGMDPRNPYANDLFKAVYAEYKAAQEGAGEQIPSPPSMLAPKRRPRPY